MEQGIERILDAGTDARYKTERLVGLGAVRAEIERICGEASVYRRFGLKPAHLLIYLDSGNGRTTVTEYMADRFRAAGVLDFTSGPDDFITIKLDGTLPQYKRAMAQIACAAVYQNHYTGIVEADVMALACRQNETQYGRFFSEFPEICRHAQVIFFAPAKPSGSEEKFLEKLISAIGDVRCLAPGDYTAQELTEIALRSIYERGVSSEDLQHVRRMLCRSLEQSQVREVKKALQLSIVPEILRHAAKDCK